jgi:hypothetical protein
MMRYQSKDHAAWPPRIDSTSNMHIQPLRARRLTGAIAHSCITLVLIVAAKAFGADPVSAPVYKSYPDAVSKPYANSVDKLERQFHVLAAPSPLTAPTYVDPPQLFDINLRRGRTNLKIVAFVVTDASGKVIQLSVLGSSDMTVAIVAGEKLSHVKWRPAYLGAVPVASAGIWQFEAAGIPK